MNALAEDQARRIATRIWNSPDLQGHVTAGMYADAEPQGASPFMKQDDIIRSRRAMHETPSDLLTNYRRLDSLLVRPERKGLWAHNRPETLRFLVVDELHTFDGAQGTDLACLVRRLKDRLAVPKESLCCIRISATLGDRNDIRPVIAYARELFDEEFDPDAVVTEDRQDAAAYLASLGDNELADRLPAQDAVADISNHAPAACTTPGSAARHQRTSAVTGGRNWADSWARTSSWHPCSESWTEARARWTKRNRLSRSALSPSCAWTTTSGEIPTARPARCSQPSANP